MYFTHKIDWVYAKLQNSAQNVPLYPTPPIHSMLKSVFSLNNCLERRYVIHIVVIIG